MTLYVITGPPCAGKSTWVKDHAQPGDIVVDLDRIALAITAEGVEHHQYPGHIRGAAIQVRRAAVQVALAYCRVGDSYVIHAKPTERTWRLYRRHRAQVIELSAPYEVLVERCRAERPPHVLAGLPTWWDTPEE